MVRATYSESRITGLFCLIIPHLFRHIATFDFLCYINTLTYLLTYFRDFGQVVHLCFVIKQYDLVLANGP